VVSFAEFSGEALFTIHFSLFTVRRFMPLRKEIIAVEFFGDPQCPVRVDLYKKVAVH
jgi:hypothetical protein